MALADSMLKYGMQKIKMSQASYLGDTISKVGGLLTEASDAVGKVSKASEPNRKALSDIKEGELALGINGSKPSLLEKAGIRSSLDKKVSYDIDGVTYNQRSLRRIGALSKDPMYSNILQKEYGKDWKKTFGIEKENNSELPSVSAKRAVQGKKAGDQAYVNDIVRGQEDWAEKEANRIRIKESYESNIPKQQSGKVEDKIIGSFINKDNDGIINDSESKTINNALSTIVSKKQQLLVDAGYNIGASGKNRDGIDGVYGKKTKKAWELYQKDNV